MMPMSPITGVAGRFLFEEKVLGKYHARYFLDESIDYIFVESPFWLEESYSSAIAVTDTGILMRNNLNVKRISSLLRKKVLHFEKGVDLGGGYGLFVRGMRDAGFQFFWQDKYAENLLARGFEAGEEEFEVAVAFEVLEHLMNPAEFLADARDKFGFQTCFFSATVFEAGNIPQKDWWYWAFETGQHISFFSRRALEAIAERLGMRLFSLGGDLYAFSHADLSGVSARPGFLERLGLDGRFPNSLTMTDHFLMVEKLRLNIR